MPVDQNGRSNPLRPPDPQTVRQEINRSGSGGSGGAPEADPREEGSGSESVDEMLAGREPDVNDEATGRDSEAVQRERTSEPDARRTHVGWTVLDRDGVRLGRVLERDDASILITLDSRGSSRARVPLRLISEEAFPVSRATLALSAGEVADLQE